eukprot:TRINITY_DN2139_c0_g1_i1.p1 TRINITY_DN2139_c0_g1~~TRINITY_DN2139_c0_g1_i1.p1  ORF type:complete len:177 (+),score=60.56 TRINITY_DN2139_c0_g1_i1:215-745(+)
MSAFHQYEVIGRHVPTERDANPKAYRIKLFSKNETNAKSRFWYFIRRIVKMKKANGEILSVREIFEKHPEKVSNYGVWIRYDSRSNTTNMYKEYRALTVNHAIEQMYQEMAGRHRARFSSIHVIKVQEIAASECLRANTKQFLKANVSFPLPHRVARANKKAHRKGTKAGRPVTCV